MLACPAKRPWRRRLLSRRFVPCSGRKSQQDYVLVKRYRNHPRLILSLDFFADGFRGPASILEDPGLWPQTVIVMTLAKVGSAAGPDLGRLEDVKAMAGKRTVVAAGGVRDMSDIRALSSMGIDAALVATSLHDGTLTPANSPRSGHSTALQAKAFLPVVTKRKQKTRTKAAPSISRTPKLRSRSGVRFGNAWQGCGASIWTRTGHPKCLRKPIPIFGCRLKHDDFPEIVTVL